LPCSQTKKRVQMRLFVKTKTFSFHLFCLLFFYFFPLSGQIHVIKSFWVQFRNLFLRYTPGCEFFLYNLRVVKGELTPPPPKKLSRCAHNAELKLRSRAFYLLTIVPTRDFRPAFAIVNS
jgi:hypothetical protein